MVRTIATRYPLIVAKLSSNGTCRIIRAMMKPNQSYTVFLEATTRHGLDAPPFYHPLDVHRNKMLQELSKCDTVHLFVFKLAITIVFWLIPIVRNKGRMEQSEHLIQPYLRVRKREYEC